MSRIAFAALLALVLTACGSGSASMKPAKNGPITFEEGLPDSGQIEIVKADGSGLRKLAPSAADQEHPVWSSDGKRIAYLSNTSGSDSGDVFVMYADGHGRRRITAGAPALLNGGLSWSPDGRELAFVGTHWPLLAVSSKGGALRTIVHPAGEPSDVAWSPDGARIAFAVLGKPTGIYVVPARGGDAKLLTRTSALDVSPSWSPDGKKIAFCREKYAEIYIVSAGGGPVSRVSHGANCGYVSWSPDGLWIAFTAAVGGLDNPNSKVFVMKRDGSGRRQVTKGLPVFSLTWQPLR